MQFIMPSVPQPGNKAPRVGASETNAAGAVPQGSFDELIAGNYTVAAETELQRPVTSAPQPVRTGSEIDKIADVFLEELFKIEDNLNTILADTAIQNPVSNAEKQELVILAETPDSTQTMADPESTTPVKLPSWGLFGSLPGQETEGSIRKTVSPEKIQATGAPVRQAQPLQPRILTADGQMTTPLQVPESARTEMTLTGRLTIAPDTENASPLSVENANEARLTRPSTLDGSRALQNPSQPVVSGNETVIQNRNHLAAARTAMQSIPTQGIPQRESLPNRIPPDGEQSRPLLNLQTPVRQPVAPVTTPITMANRATGNPRLIPAPQPNQLAGFTQLEVPVTGGGTGAPTRELTQTETDSLRSLANAGLQVRLGGDKTQPSNAAIRRLVETAAPRPLTAGQIVNPIQTNSTRESATLARIVEPIPVQQARSTGPIPVQTTPAGPNFSARFTRVASDPQPTGRWQAPVTADPGSDLNGKPMQRMPVRQAVQEEIPQGRRFSQPLVNRPQMPQRQWAPTESIPQPHQQGARAAMQNQMPVRPSILAPISAALNPTSTDSAREAGQTVNRPLPQMPVITPSAAQAPLPQTPATMPRATLPQTPAATPRATLPQTPAAMPRATQAQTPAAMPRATQAQTPAAMPRAVEAALPAPAQPQPALALQAKPLRQVYATSTINQNQPQSRPVAAAEMENDTKPATAWWLRDLTGSREEIQQVITNSQNARTQRAAGVLGERVEVADPMTKGWSEDQRPRSGGPEGGLSNWPLHELTDERAAQPSHPVHSQVRTAAAEVTVPVQPARSLETATQISSGTVETNSAQQPLLSPRSAAVSAQTAYYLRMSLRTNRREIMVNLDPPDLGRMQIRLQEKGNGMIARISVQVPEVEALLKEGSNMIRDRLSEQGLRIDSIIIEKLVVSNQPQGATGREDANGQDSQSNGHAHQQKQSGTFGSDTTGSHSPRQDDSGRQANQTADRTQRHSRGDAQDANTDSAGRQDGQPAARGRRLGVDIRA